MSIALLSLSLIVVVSGGLVDSNLRRTQYNVLETLKSMPEENLPLDEVLQDLPKVKLDHVGEEEYSIPEINEKSGVDEELFQGDILLTKSQTEDIKKEINEEIGGTSRNKRQALTHPYYLWPGGNVYYRFDASVDERVRRIFSKGAALWQKDSCVNFIYDPNFKAANRIVVKIGQGCLAAIGKNGGEQLLSLGKGCDMVSIAAHEIGHALGLYHTMSRHDRDNYIIVNMANVEPYYRNQLFRGSAETFQLPYDYGSIMHYSGSSVSINKMQPAMVSFDLDYQQTLGSPFVSFIDLSMINKLYGCKIWCNAASSVHCAMGGFPNPRNCSKCVCPGGYGGDQCTERPNSGCGSTIEASPYWNTLTDVLGDVSVRKPLEDFTVCNYWITSPPGTEIEIILLSFSNNFGVNGCVFDGVEIKTNKDQRLTGYRFCSNSAAFTRLRSYANRVPIITWNRLYRSEMRLLYRYASRILRPLYTTNTPFPFNFWTSGEAARRCVDHPSCSYLHYLRSPYATTYGLCYGQSTTSALIRIYCPKACYRCFTPNYASIASGVRRFV